MRLHPALAVGLAVLSVLCCGGSGVLDPQGPVGRANLTIMVDATVIMLCIVVPTILLALFVAWRYRESNTKARYMPEWAYSGRIEAIVWAIPILVIMFLGGVIWIGSNKLDPFAPLQSREKTVNVQVVSLDWKWLFIYPDDGVASVNRLVVPAGAPVHFSITSASVMNVFWVPQLGSMIYAMNGMVTQLHLQADHPGTYRGLSAQFSGDGFSDMNFQVNSLPAGQYAAWVAQARQSGQALDRSSYAALTRQSSNLVPYTYRAVQPGLFQDIATQKAAPGPGPAVQSGAREASHRAEN
jgi:cytochrome o ubiquinol oxidase subunit 2